MHPCLCRHAAHLPGPQNACVASAVFCFSLTQLDLDFECSLLTAPSLVQAGFAIIWPWEGVFVRNVTFCMDPELINGNKVKWLRIQTSELSGFKSLPHNSYMTFESYCT